MTSDERRYAVAVRDGDDLWLALWVRRSRKPEFFVIRPMPDPDRDVHTSYHSKGDLHTKSYGHKFIRQKHQPLTVPFEGFVDLGTDCGFSPKRVGFICDPSKFSGVVEVPPGILGPNDGAVGVIVAAPDCEVPSAYYTWHAEIVSQRRFAELVPNVVITILRQKEMA